MHDDTGMEKMFKYMEGRIDDTKAIMTWQPSEQPTKQTSL